MSNVVTCNLPTETEGKVKIRLLESDVKRLVEGRNVFLSELTFERFQTLCAIVCVPYEAYSDYLKVWVPYHVEDSPNYADSVPVPEFIPVDLTGDIHGFDNSAYSPEPQVSDLLGTEPIGIPSNPETVRSIERKMLQKVMRTFKMDDGIPSGLCRLFSEYGL